MKVEHFVRNKEMSTEMKSIFVYGSECWTILFTDETLIVITEI